MSRPPKKQSGEARNPFGIAPLNQSAGTISIPDAVRRARWIALDIGASYFGLFLTGLSAKRPLLIGCFDASYPDVSAHTKAICGEERPEILRHMRLSTVPVRWEAAGVEASQPELPWCETVEPLTAGTAGIAFPVQATHGLGGLVVFAGTDLTIEPDELYDIHGRCFALFDAVAPSLPSHGNARAISKRELECLKLTANGYTSEEIARFLKLSVHTANQYLTNSTQKLDAMNRAHAVAKALRIGLIE